MTARSSDIEKVIPTAIRKKSTSGATLMETLRDAEAADVADLIQSPALDLRTLETAGTDLISFYSHMEATRTEVLKALAKVVVLIRSKHRDDEGNIDWRGKTWDYRQAIGEMYERAGVPPDSQSGIQSALRYHVGNLIREVATPDELQAAGLLKDSPRDRLNEQRNLASHLWHTLSEIPAAPTNVAEDEAAEAAEEEFTHALQDSMEERSRWLAAANGQLPLIVDLEESQVTDEAARWTKADLLKMAKTVRAISERIEVKKVGRTDPQTVAEIQTNFFSAIQALIHAQETLLAASEQTDPEFTETLPKVLVGVVPESEEGREYLNGPFKAGRDAFATRFRKRTVSSGKRNYHGGTPVEDEVVIFHGPAIQEREDEVAAEELERVGNSERDRVRAVKARRQLLWAADHLGLRYGQYKVRSNGGRSFTFVVDRADLGEVEIELPISDIERMDDMELVGAIERGLIPPSSSEKQSSDTDTDQLGKFEDVSS